MMNECPKGVSPPLAGALVAALFTWFAAACAAQGYPDKPIRMVVAFAPGGAPDVIGRIVGQRLADRLGQPVIIDNRPGATGNIGAEIVAKAPADGHTLFMATVSVAISPSFYRSLPFDPVKSFEPVGRVAIVPLLLVVHPSLPVRSVAELVNLARSKPGTLNYASVGPGSPQHLTGELFNSTAGIKTVHVAYKGGGPATTAILGGETQFFFAGMPPALPHVKAGRLRGLAVSTASRSPSAPEIPTVSEAGLAGFEADNWHGLLAPHGTPRARVDRLNRELAQVLGAADIQSQLVNAGAQPVTGTPAEFAAFIRAETDKWNRVARLAGVKAQ